MVRSGRHAAALRIKESLGFSRGKNDKIDSYRIARYAYLHQDEARLWMPQRKVVQQLAHLTTLRKRLLKTKVALQQPLNETKSFLGDAAFRIERIATDPVVKATEKQLKSVEKQIESLIQGDETLRELFELVTSVEAIGPVTAGHLLVVTARRPPTSLRALAVLRNSLAMQVLPPLRIVLVPAFGRPPRGKEPRVTLCE